MDLARQDIGLGTAYERHATYCLIRRWLGQRDIHTALEGPHDGFAGMPGLHLLPLARRGTRVTVVLHQAEAIEQVQRVYRRCGLIDRLQTRVGDTLDVHGSFDLVLSFNALPLVPNWRAELDRLAACSARYLLLFVTNTGSYGVSLRRMLRALEHNPPAAEVFDHAAVQPRLLEPALSHLGQVRESAFVDCPWWPDLFVPAGQTLVGGSLRRLVGVTRATSGHASARLVSAAARLAHDAAARYAYDAESFPFCDDDLPSVLRAALRRHPVFDRAPTRLGRFFGHHRAYLVEVAGAR